MAAPLAMLTPKILIPPTGLSTALQKRIDDAADLTRIAHSKIGRAVIAELRETLTPIRRSIMAVLEGIDPNAILADPHYKKIKRSYEILLGDFDCLEERINSAAASQLPAVRLGAAFAPAAAAAAAASAVASVTRGPPVTSGGGIGSWIPRVGPNGVIYKGVIQMAEAPPIPVSLTRIVLTIRDAADTGSTVYLQYNVYNTTDGTDLGHIKIEHRGYSLAASKMPSVSQSQITNIGCTSELMAPDICRLLLNQAIDDSLRVGLIGNNIRARCPKFHLPCYELGFRPSQDASVPYFAYTSIGEIFKKIHEKLNKGEALSDSENRQYAERSKELARRRNVPPESLKPADVCMALCGEEMQAAMADEVPSIDWLGFVDMDLLPERLEERRRLVGSATGIGSSTESLTASAGSSRGDGWLVAKPDRDVRTLSPYQRMPLDWLASIFSYVFAPDPEKMVVDELRYRFREENPKNRSSFEGVCKLWQQGIDTHFMKYGDTVLYCMPPLTIEGAIQPRDPFWFPGRLRQGDEPTKGNYIKIKDGMVQVSSRYEPYFHDNISRQERRRRLEESSGAFNLPLYAVRRLRDGFLGGSTISKMRVASLVTEEELSRFQTQLSNCASFGQHLNLAILGQAQRYISGVKRLATEGEDTPGGAVARPELDWSPLQNERELTLKDAMSAYQQAVLALGAARGFCYDKGEDRLVPVPEELREVFGCDTMPYHQAVALIIDPVLHSLFNRLNRIADVLNLVPVRMSITNDLLRHLPRPLAALVAEYVINPKAPPPLPRCLLPGHAEYVERSKKRASGKKLLE